MEIIPSKMDHNYGDIQESLTDGRLFHETEGLFKSIQDQVVGTRNYRKKLSKKKI